MTIPTPVELAGCMHAVSLPMITPFRGITQREILIFDGPDGLCEWSPFSEYADQEAATWLQSTIEQGWGQESLQIPPGLPDTLGVNGTLPALDAALVPEFMKTLHTPTTVKIKVGGPGSSLASDVARVEAVRTVLGPEGRIRVDANGCWTLDEAEHAIRAMETFDVDYVEQPVVSLPDMAELRRRITRLGIQIAADESIRRLSDIDTVLEAKACDLIVLKVQPLGGIRKSLDIAQKAAAAGVEVVVSSALESSVGIYYGAVLATLLSHQGYPPHDSGLGTVSLFESDVVTTPLIPHSGELRITQPVLDQALVEHYAMTPEREQWWSDRLMRCFALL